MTSFREYAPQLFVSFKENKTQRVIFDPDAPIQEGKYGAQVLVQQAGEEKWLSIGSKRLWAQLKNFNTPTTIEIVQDGTGTATTYKVTPVKK